MKRPSLVLVLMLCGALVVGIVGCDELTTSATTGGATGTTVTASSEITSTTAPGESLTTAPETVTTAAPPGTTTATAPLTTTTTAPPGPSVWTDLDPGGPTPPARQGAAMVCNPNTGRVVLFGGYNWVSYFNDLWVYNPEGNVWISLSPAGSTPAARRDHTLVYESVHGNLLLFGGGNEVGDLNDLWAYSPPTDTWTQLSPAGGPPPARERHCAFFDPDTAKMYVFGGSHGSTRFNDLWAYDPAANTWTQLTPGGSVPAAREDATMAFNPGSGRATLFGGFNGSDLDDIVVYNPDDNVWIPLSPSGAKPSGRSFTDLVYDSAGTKAILFGGFQYDGEIQRDTWSFNPATGNWTQLSLPGDLPDARADHSMCYATGVHKWILFGGTNDEWLYDDTWAYGPEG
jgi:N-acetylneuraminic acid mutarotase